MPLSLSLLMMEEEGLPPGAREGQRAGRETNIHQSVSSYVYVVIVLLRNYYFASIVHVHVCIWSFATYLLCYLSPEDNTLLVNSEELDNFKTLRKEMQEGKLELDL